MNEWEWTVNESGELVKTPIDPNQPKVLKPNPPRRMRENSKYEHGNHLRYYTDGCRCDDCRRAATLYAKQVRHKRYQTPFSEIPHGTKNGYANFGCRCEPCTKAMRAYARQYPESPEAKAKRNERKKAKRALEKANRQTSV